MTDGYAYATGEVGVVLVTSGFGVINAVTGIVTASILLVVLLGQMASSLIVCHAFQERDMIGISRPVVKHSSLIKKTEVFRMC